MRKILGLAMAVAFASAGASAHEPDVTNCKVEAFRWYKPFGKRSTMMRFEGTATCSVGRVVLRIYEKSDGEKGRFLGVATGDIEGYAFGATAMDIGDVSPIKVEYVIVKAK